VGGWLIRWCVSCGLMVQLPRQPVLASEQPRVSVRQLGYSQLAARTGDPVAQPRGTIMAVQTRPVSCPSRSSGGGSGTSHSPLGPLSADRKINCGILESISGKCAFERARSPNRSDFILGPPIPCLRTAGLRSTAYELHAEPHAPITAGLSVIRPERT
jgi:hypothetical protein